MRSTWLRWTLSSAGAADGEPIQPWPYLTLQLPGKRAWAAPMESRGEVLQKWVKRGAVSIGAAAVLWVIMRDR